MAASPEPGPALVVGLGNPGKDYAGTRHNAGALVLDELARRVGGSFKVVKGRRAEALEGRLVDRRVILAKPTSYMNESGGPVKALMDWFKVGVADLVVVHDELDVPWDALRVKAGGGSGGHNGIRDIDKALGVKDYARVRFGIGRPPGRQDAADFVLRDWSAAERKELPFLLDRAADAVELVLSDGLAAAQNRYHAS